LKTVKSLFNTIPTFDNLLLATRKARMGKRYKEKTSKFEENLENEIIKLQHELTTKTYRPGKYRSFDIYEPKKRMISAAPYRDRVVHHALCNIIEPVFEPAFIFDSYANRKGKGTHRAILKYQHFARTYKYVLKADIQKYFPSIDHQTLKQAIRRKITCKDTLWLIEMIIDNSNPQEPVFNLFPGDDLFTASERRRGIPIGNLTSQFFANIYLNAFDHFIKETLRCKAYIRYVDDFVIFSNSKNELWEILRKCALFLQNYRLVLHPKKSTVHRVRDGVEFLGHRVFPKCRLLKKQNIHRFKKRFRKMVRLFYAGKLTKEKLVCRYNSWQGHAAFSKTYRLRFKIYRFLRYKGINTKWVSCMAIRGTIPKNSL